jgi:hypothetical protein
VKQLQDTEQRVKHQATYIQELEFQLRLKEAYQENLLRDRAISSLPSAPPASPPAGLMPAHEIDIIQDEHAIQQLLESLALKKQAYTQQQRTHSPVLMVPESPGPHRLQPRPERPQDVAYRQQQLDQAQAEQQTSSTRDTNSRDEMMNVFKSLTKVLSDNNKQLHSNDVSDPLKLNGQDSHWDDWYLQWRTFLEAKGWLSTFEHTTGPDTIGFDNEIIKKIYNKLLSLCQKDTASTYVTKAANFNGWEAAKSPNPAGSAW